MEMNFLKKIKNKKFQKIKISKNKKFQKIKNFKK